VNWIDLIIFIIVGIYLWDGYKRGLIKSIAELLGFILTALLALKFYFIGQAFFTNLFNIPQNFAKALGFISLFVILQLVYYIGLRYVYPKIPKQFWQKWYEKDLGVIPALLKSLVILAVFLTFVISFPAPGWVKNAVLESKIGSALVKNALGTEKVLTNIFGGAVNDTLTFITVKPEPESGETVDLGFKTTNVSVDEAAEVEMLKLVNQERTKRGLEPLVLDITTREVARLHSKDMFVRGYFSHINPDAKNPFDRMKEGGVKFGAAGENLALAPNVQIAHEGLMNSPGHRANLLEPSFRKIGIGVLKSNIYGEMFTQNFTD